jgi:hypothetical protein
MEFKEPIEISRKDLETLKHYKDNLLFLGSRLTMIGEITYEEKTVQKKVRTGLFSSKTVEENKIFLTGMELWGWQSQRKFWGLVDSEGAKLFVMMYNIDNLRENYIEKIREPLQALGVNFEVKAELKKES